MEFYGYALPPDAGMSKRLSETATWVTGDGTTRPLSDMDSEHLQSVLGYLVRHGHALWQQAHPGALKYPADGAIVRWLIERPLWLAVVLILRDRGVIGPREDIFTGLRVRAAVYRSAAVSQYSKELDEQESLFFAR